MMIRLSMSRIKGEILIFIEFKSIVPFNVGNYTDNEVVLLRSTSCWDSKPLRVEYVLA
jgi:hypothetical protein